MYDIELTQMFLTENEQSIFNNYIQELGLDTNIWQIFRHLFRQHDKDTEPYLVKAYSNSELRGVVIVLKCKKYGKSLFNNNLLSGLIDYFAIPIYLWIKLGCGMDFVSNSGFTRDPNEDKAIFSAMIAYFQKKNQLLMVNDYSSNSKQYDGASILPALPHGEINISEYYTIDDYLCGFKNIKRKIRVFRGKGGKCEVISSGLNDRQLSQFKECFISTTKRSIFYLPYQELYFKLATLSSNSDIHNVFFFVATLNDKMVGYQAALKSGDSLKVLHGAFDRNQKTLYHAYDVIFVKMVEFALENKLKMIDFGVIINTTKERMVNSSKEMSYFLIAKHQIVRSLFKNFLKLTKIQQVNQVRFKVT